MWMDTGVGGWTQEWVEVGSETKLAVSETEVVVSVVVFENEVAVNAGMELGMEASVAVF